MSKFKGKRMVDEDLIKKLIDLQPGGGGEYTAGTGIDISDQNEISVDTDTIATKEYVDQHAGTTYTAGVGIDIDANNEITANIKAGSGIVVDTDLTDDSIVVMIDQADIPYKSDLSTVATTGDYDDLTNKPDLSVYAETADLATVATTGAYSDLSGIPTLATVATTGDYDDLTNKPTIPTVDYPVTDVTVNGTSVVSSKIASITVPTKVSDLTNDSGFITSVAWGDVTGKPSFATVATSGDYDDLTNKPTIPAAQVNADWNAASGVAQILNKPSIPSSASSTSTVTPTTETLTFTYSDNTTGTITFLTAVAVNTTTTLS